MVKQLLLEKENRFKKGDVLEVVYDARFAPKTRFLLDYLKCFFFGLVILIGTL